WEPGGRPRRAGVSSFGISGTNAHLILEEAPPAPAREPSERAPVVAAGAAAALPFVVSGASDEALRAQAGRLGEHLEGGDLDPYAVASTLATRRAHLDHRAAAVASGPAELVAALRALADGEPAEGAVRGVAGTGRTALLFAGQGSQWAGMGAELYEQFPAFAQAFDEACAALDRHLDRPLREVVFADPDGVLADTRFTQVALFALELALFRLIESFGIAPDYLIGHSIGEFTAAYVAGVFSLDDGARLVAERARLMSALPSGGAMLAVEASEEEVAEGLPERLAIAAVNGPRAVVVSGEEEAIADFEARWSERRTRRLRVSHAFHSRLVEPMLDGLEAVVRDVALSEPRIPIVSNVTGERLTAEQARSPEYWVRHVRQTVRFADGIGFLREAGVTRFIELGPDGTLTAMAAQTADDEGLLLVSALHRDHQRAALLGALASAHCHGVAVDWRPLLGRGVGRVELPNYGFQRTRYWLEAGAGDVAAAGLGSTEHPLLRAAVRLAGEEGWLFTGRLSPTTHPWLADHAVAGTVLLPGTAFVEIALAAARRTGAGGLADLTLVAPLVLDGERALQVTVAGPDEDGRRAVNVYSAARGAADAEADEAGWTLHASGLLEADAEAGDVPALASWPPEGAEEVDLETVYDDLWDAGYAYGPAFRGLRRAWHDGTGWYAEVALDEKQRSQAPAFEVHPALADAALHPILVAALERDGGGPPAVPFSFTGVRLHLRGAASLRVRIEAVEGGHGETARLVAYDDVGEPVLEIEALRSRQVDPADLRARFGAGGRGDDLLAVDWVQVGAESEDGLTASAALLEAAPSNGASAGWSGLPVEAALPGAELARHPDLAALERAVGEGAPAPDVVLVRAGTAGGPLARAVGDLAERTLDLFKAWLASEALSEARLVLLTEGALAVAPGESPNLTQAALLGLARSAHSENPLRFGTIDLDPGDPSAEGLASALASEEPELALRGGAMLAPRLARVGSGAARASGLIPPGGAGGWRLGIEREGSLEDLGLLAGDAAERPLDEGEVRVAMRAAGLNFRDVLIALGMYPGEAPLGSEGAGVVVEVGPGVEDLAPGERVMGLLDDAFASHAITDRLALVKVPDGWSDVEAASTPGVFLTAYYALVDVADLRPGERVLVHAAAGGVGMAAVQIAQQLGAEVYATASSPKWDALRDLGIDDAHIASSRDLDFRQRFMDATGGEGVDVVLDALVGEFVDASLDLLPRGGRFVEIGKADVREADTVAADHEGVRYRAFDLAEAGPERTRAMLVEVLELFDRGALRHLPISTWDVRRAPDAFRHMREAQHVGKIVLSVPRQPDPERTVLITGGTGGLGALVARHLAERGMKRLLLTSRRGASAPGAVELVDELSELGCEARVAACDVADREQLASLLDGLELTSVIHAAGVLDDGLISSLDGERLGRVMAPKVDAAIHLHELTADGDLAEFVVFSSFASTLGSPGQGSYAAANAFLDALAQHRRARGLPANALAWGAWDRATAMTERGDRQRWERLGMIPLADEQGLELLDTARRAAQPVLVPVRLDPRALRAQAKAGVLPAVLRGLVRAPAHRSTESSLARRLAAAPELDRAALALDLVRGHVATVLGHGSPQAIDADRMFKDLGFDSLSAVELRNRLAQAAGIKLPATVIFDHPTPAAVAEYLCENVAGAPRPRPAPATPARREEEPIALVGIGCRY
ncbi:MAG TPA: type I polyketide synthase, partial [Thermoleophilaceae bacterium]